MVIYCFITALPNFNIRFVDGNNVTMEGKMAKGMMKNGKKIAQWAVASGLSLAVIISLLERFTTMSIAMSGTILVIVGIIVGLMNITKTERASFLTAGLTLSVMGGMAVMIPLIGGFVEILLRNLAVMIAPAMLIVAVTTVFATGKN